MRIIGLTGGIAAGKSTVSARWAEHGAVIVDADKLARQAVDPGTPGLAAIEQRFGSGVIAPDGSLDRPALGAIVFADPEALADLNAITHPEVWRLAQERFAAAIMKDLPTRVTSQVSAPRPVRERSTGIAVRPSQAPRPVDRDEQDRRTA